MRRTNRRHSIVRSFRSRLYLGALGWLAAGTVALADPTVTILPSAVEVRSSFTSDGQLELLKPKGLSDDGVVVGNATDLQRDYDYDVAWYWSRSGGLRAVDPTNGNRPFVDDPRNRKTLRSVCEVAAGERAFCTDDVGDVLYTYTEADGVEILDRGNGRALDAIAATFSDENLSPNAPIQFVWKTGNERGDAGLLAAAPGPGGGRDTTGLLHSPEAGWRLLSSLDDRLGGHDAIVDPQQMNEGGDLLLNYAPPYQHEIFLVREGGDEVVRVGFGAGFISTACDNLTDDGATCGAGFEGDWTTPVADREYHAWSWSPEDGPAELPLRTGLVPRLVLPDGDLLVTGEGTKGKAIDWQRYAPDEGRLDRILGRGEYKSLFPRGTKKLHRDASFIGPAGDLILLLSGRFDGQTMERIGFFPMATGQLTDLWDLIRQAEWIDEDEAGRAPSRTSRATFELVLFVEMNAHGESLWLAYLDGRPRAVVISP